MQLDLLEWRPPAAEIIKHPVMFRAIWADKVDDIADHILADPSRAAGLWTRLPICLAEDLVAAGANESETSRQVQAFMQALTAAVARRRTMRQGPETA